MCGDTLIESDQLVDLRTGQTARAPGSAHQLFQPGPFPGMYGDEGVDVH